MSESTAQKPDGMDDRAWKVVQECRGFLDPTEGARLLQLARDHAHLGPILEVGSYCGKSSVYVGTGARAGGGTAICLDHHRGSEEHQKGEGYHEPELYDEAIGKMDTLPSLRRTIHDAGLEDSVVLMVTKSAQAASVWTTPLGMVFIDGGHSFEAAETDLAAWSPKVAPGGVLAIHDLFPNPDEGGQAPITIYRKALASGDFDELETTGTLGVLRRK